MTLTQSALPIGPQGILDVARELGVSEDHVEPYGRNKAKIDLAALTRPAAGAGRLVLVSAINPTPAGEGKTTTSIALAMGMRRLAKRAVLCLREPSLGPVFGVKGGGTGGGRATLMPADDINLHFTGDIHAISTAHNLLSAMVDNACHFNTTFGDKGAIDPRQVTWGRALDMNDRALRNVMVGLGRKADGVPRQDRFDITAASEVMAIVALAEGPEDLEKRLGRIVIGQSTSSAPITAADVGAAAAMTALLRDAIKPNLVQTDEGGPALVHAGPFANIAHGCSSVLATRLGLLSGDYVITEAGFGFDLGGEKFLDIKCRTMGVFPRVLVLVATLRALKMHGGAPVKRAAEPDPRALELGLTHLDKHLDSAAFFGLPVVVSINVFPNDTQEELALVEAAMQRRGVRAVRCEGFLRGGEGALDLAEAVATAADATDGAPPAPRFVYNLGEPLRDKITKIARTVYGAEGVTFTAAAERDARRIEELGHGGVPVCMAKTQLSLSDDPALVGRPTNFQVTVRELRLSAGAGFAVALTGDMMTMPGLPREPSALRVKLLPTGKIRGLMQND
ncbi:formate--tetrahydrofolate ligase [Polyangium mundeleinium]|uniref:Formate--tetrahydrofolate ligase n=1 Tax=Polyangium mundeleinium TaxID=2995306 RepID=A0ABT5EYZ1_9BACT|nr:formate--tetrahydrofolate ligase [Polyangium mundeleinium]MDC0747030.1 formate--tetrahydrofolate ligase [Polyangium mundeleinium]